MKNQQNPQLKTHLLTSALVLSFMAFAPTATAECGDLDDRCTYPAPTAGIAGSVDCSESDPGEPGDGGTTGAAEWFVNEEFFLSCSLMDSVEDSLLLHAGDMTWRLGLVATGGAGLFDPSVFVPAVVVFQTEATNASTSQAQDTCAAFLGDTNCGPDPAVSQDLQCPGGLSIPNPIGAGLVGDSLDNTNGALQATCVLVNSSSAAAPTVGDVTDYANNVQAIVLEVGGDVFAFASDSNDAACIFLSGSTPCI